MGGSLARKEDVVNTQLWFPKELHSFRWFWVTILALPHSQFSISLLNFLISKVVLQSLKKPPYLRGILAQFWSSDQM